MAQGEGMKRPEWKDQGLVHRMNLAEDFVRIRVIDSNKGCWVTINGEQYGGFHQSVADAKEAGVQHAQALVQQAQYELAQIRMAQPIQQPLPTAALVAK